LRSIRKAPGGKLKVFREVLNNICQQCLFRDLETGRDWMNMWSTKSPASARKEITGHESL
jgi:hypothetical protein